MKPIKTLAVVIVVVVAAFLVHAVMKAREAARESSCRCRLCVLQTAFRHYEFDHGSLPPAYVLGPDGKPWHSWRVLILPYMDLKDVYDRYRFDEPWNGPNNRQLANQINVEAFQCFSGKDYKKTFNTNIVAVVGEGTAFPFEKTTRFADFLDGPENTILLLEIGDTGIHWMEPRDLRLDSLSFTEAAEKMPVVASHHPAGPGAAFGGDLVTYRLRPPFRLDTLRALLTIAGGEPITRDSLVAADDRSVLSDNRELQPKEKARQPLEK